MADNDMDVDAPEEGAEEEKPKKKKSPMMLIIIIVGVLVLGAGGYFGWMFFMADDTPPEGAKPAGEQAAAEGETAKDKAPEAPLNVLDMDPFIVNLADPTGKRYLKLKLAVDAKDEELKKELERRMPQIRDSILLLLTSKTYEDISTVAGKIRLRNEVLQIINRSLGEKGSVHSVYFTDFVVQ